MGSEEGQVAMRIMFRLRELIAPDEAVQPGDEQRAPGE